MRGKYSKNEFFKKYPKISPTYFQGSDSTLAEDIEKLFEMGKSKLLKYENANKTHGIHKGDSTHSMCHSITSVNLSIAKISWSSISTDTRFHPLLVGLNIVNHTNLHRLIVLGFPWCISHGFQDLCIPE